MQTGFGWAISRNFLRAAEWLRFERSQFERSNAIRKLSTYFEHQIVEHGFFKGLKYPNLSSAGSSLYPKLSGSYENELSAVFAARTGIKYHKIIDVGCAEGFYAVGLAIKFPASQVIAFDIDENARLLCTKMAEANRVSLSVMAACTDSYFTELDANSRNLIVCDCEGYEGQLFNDKNIKSFSNTDLIVELHPMHAPGIKERLHMLFKKSHHISYVSSYDDARKISDLPATYADFSPLERLILVQEGRPFTMDWLIATPNLSISC